MLQLFIPKAEYWDEKKEEFVYVGKDVTLKLEHSLISISKWEAKWHVSFFQSEKTNEMLLSYIECMTLNSDVDQSIYLRLTKEHYDQINKYLSDSMTASTVKDIKKHPRTNEILTSELIYYYMIQYGIPVEFEKWHINRLIMLIKICGAKGDSGAKMSRSEIFKQNKALNEARKAKWHTRG